MNIASKRPGRILPDDVQVYKVVGPFAGDEIPDALFARHNTDAGIWAKLHIISGNVQYISYDSAEKFFLTMGDEHIIIPREWHYLSLPEGSQRSDLKLQVTLYKTKSQ